MNPPQITECMLQIFILKTPAYVLWLLYWFVLCAREGYSHYVVPLSPLDHVCTCAFVGVYLSWRRNKQKLPLKHNTRDTNVGMLHVHRKNAGMWDNMKQQKGSSQLLNLSITGRTQEQCTLFIKVCEMIWMPKFDVFDASVNLGSVPSFFPHFLSDFSCN